MTRPPATGQALAAAPACAACGAPVSGRFCSKCGAPTEGGSCPACRTPLSPGARFCHRCGAAARSASAGRERIGWIVAGVALILALVVIVWRSGAFKPTVPDMANAGNAGPALEGRAPDISGMSPRERFDRLFERVIRAGEANDTATVIQFAPMALGAYSQLDSVNTDARFHAAMIDLAIGEFAAARALADTILSDAPGHLFAYLLRGEAADRQKQAAALTVSYREFLAHYDAEMRAGRAEYAEHRPVLDEFRTRARASLGQ
jgi:hypothetical protein